MQEQQQKGSSSNSKASEPVGKFPDGARVQVVHSGRLATVEKYWPADTKNKKQNRYRILLDKDASLPVSDLRLRC